MSNIDLVSEWRAARAAFTPEHRQALLDLGVPASLIILFPLVGAVRIATTSDTYQPAEDGELAFVTPVRVDPDDAPIDRLYHPSPDAITRGGEIVDMVAWNPVHPDRWALRIGAATSLGHADSCSERPAPVRRSPLSWLQGGALGIVPLTRDHLDVQIILLSLYSIQAEDAAHGREIRAILRRPSSIPPIFIPSAGATAP